MARAVDLHRCVGALVTAQLERSIDKALDIPFLHADFTGISHGRFDS